MTDDTGKKGMLLMLDLSYNVTDYGARGDGKTLNTKAIQAAVNACAAAGGGRVVMPAGVFVSGPIFLRSNLEFHLGAGAVLRGTTDFEQYPAIELAMQGYHIRHWCASLLTGIGLRDVAITGQGVIDGNGEPWWRAMDEQRLNNRPSGLKRPVLVSLNDCERVCIRDVKAMTSPSWTFRLCFCRIVTIDGVSVENSWNHYHNTDGINLVSCRNARIVNSHVDTGDDGITLKSVPDFHLTSTTGQPDYTKPQIPCENILVANCTVRHAHGGVVIGSETVRGVRQVAVSNCVFDGTRSGIKVKASQFGGAVEDLRVSNIVMRRVELAIDLHTRDPFEACMQAGHPRVATMRGLHFNGITIRQSCIGIRVKGQAGFPARDISFCDMDIDADQGVLLQHADHVLFDRVSVETRGTPMIADDVANLELGQFNTVPISPALPVLQFNNVRNGWIRNCTALPGTGVFLGLVGGDNTVEMTGNRLADATHETATVEPACEWNTCSHAFSGSRMIRDTGDRNHGLPVSSAVMATIRKFWSSERVDKIWSVSRVEANSRKGAETDDPDEPRRIYIIEPRDTVERLVIFEDGELLRRVDDEGFHAHYDFPTTSGGGRREHGNIQCGRVRGGC